MEAISRFKLSDYRIVKTIIEFQDTDNVSPHLSTTIDVEGKDDRAHNRFILKIEAKIWDENENMSIQVIAMGTFEFDPDCEEKELGAYFNTNAPALLFPYVRAYITSLTAQAGISPIVLPTFNISRLGQELKEKTEKI